MVRLRLQPGHGRLMPLELVRRGECWVEFMKIAPDPEEGVWESGICVWVSTKVSAEGWLTESREEEMEEMEAVGSLLSGESGECVKGG